MRKSVVILSVHSTRSLSSGNTDISLDSVKNIAKNAIIMLHVQLASFSDPSQLPVLFDLTLNLAIVVVAIILSISARIRKYAVAATWGQRKSTLR